MHLLKLSDGRPHPLAPIDQTAFHVNLEAGEMVTKLVALISEHRLVVVATTLKSINWPHRSNILTWDWQNARKTHVSFLNSARKKWGDFFNMLELGILSHLGDRNAND